MPVARTEGSDALKLLRTLSKRGLIYQMTAEEKNRISHRYRALVEMRELLLRLELVRET